jgi:hypothetical protein
VPDDRAFPTRLERVLAALGAAIGNAGAATFRGCTMTVVLPGWVGPARRSDEHLSMVVVTTTDEEGQDTLTLLVPPEACSL